MYAKGGDYMDKLNIGTKLREISKAQYNAQVFSGFLSKKSMYSIIPTQRNTPEYFESIAKPANAPKSKLPLTTAAGTS